MGLSWVKDASPSRNSLFQRLIISYVSYFVMYYVPHLRYFSKITLLAREFYGSVYSPSAHLWYFVMYYNISSNTAIGI